MQVKFRLDARSHLRWEEISTALSFRPDLFARRLIVTNAADRTANARRATEMTPNTSWILRADILASPIDWTGALATGTGEATLTRLIREPRPYQATAVADVVASLAEHERAQLLMACGSGGHARVPFGYATDSGLNLGQIVNEYRTAFKAGAMQPERTRTLETVPGWHWDPRADDFASAVALLTDYAREHGNVDVPRSYRSESGMRLGHWCSTRRHEHRKGRLSVERIAALEAVPGWRWTQ